MADNKFLDQAGLQIVWDKIKLKFADKVKLTELQTALKESIEAVRQEIGTDYLDKEATKKAISDAITALLDGAPEDLDTLKELADLLRKVAMESLLCKNKQIIIQKLLKNLNKIAFLLLARTVNTSLQMVKQFLSLRVKMVLLM